LPKKLSKGTIVLLAGLIFGVVLIGVGALIAATTLLSCPSVLYDQDLYYAGASVASLSAVGLAYTFRGRVGMVIVAVAVAVAVVIFAVSVAGFIYGLCGTFI